MNSTKRKALRSAIHRADNIDFLARNRMSSEDAEAIVLLIRAARAYVCDCGGSGNTGRLVFKPGVPMNELARSSSCRSTITDCSPSMMLNRVGVIRSMRSICSRRGSDASGRVNNDWMNDLDRQ